MPCGRVCGLPCYIAVNPLQPFFLLNVSKATTNRLIGTMCARVIINVVLLGWMQGAVSGQTHVFVSTSPNLHALGCMALAACVAWLALHTHMLANIMLP